MPINGSVSHGDGDTIPEDLEEDYFPPNFKEYMLKEQLKWSRHTRVYFQNSYYFGWVFWSEQDRQIEPSLSLDNFADFNPNVCAIPKVRDNITLALQKLILYPQLTGCLVQFWAATKTLEGRTKLTTQYQPFALGIIEDTTQSQQLCEYRMKMCSSEYNNCFYADADIGEEQLGNLGRVFLHKYPEFTPSVKYYSKKEYPQLDDAIECFIRGSWALPVFEHSSQTCVGVLEMVAWNWIDSAWHDESFLHNMHDIFQEFGLICFDGYTHCEKQCRVANDKARTTAFQELNMVLRSVCEICKLPLAMTWVPCSACNDILRGQLMSEVLKYVDEQGDNDNDKVFYISNFLEMGKVSHLRKGGVSDRVLSSPYMLYCSDITQLSIAEYPLVHYARLCNFRGSFTICLQRSYTDKEVYVVDFFLPTSSKDDEFLLTTLSLILGTMQEKFKTFTLASGQQLGEKVWVELMDFRNGKKFPFVQMIQLPSPQLLKDRRLMLQLGQLDQPSTDAIHSGINVISEEQNYILTSLQALQNGEATMQLDSPHQPPLDPSNYELNGVTAEENITVVTSLQEGKRKTQRQNKGTGVRIEVSLDDILKCAKMKRREAAEKLKVSESTFKRVCREHDIDRWPPRNIKTITQLPPSHVENQGQTVQLNSDLPSNQAVPGVAHMKPGVQDANRVTIRAKYKNKTIKFHLSFSSRLVEFEQEVAKRLHLEAGTYYAEYKDEEGELIFIACDDDLHDCMHTLRSQGNTSIELLLKLEEPLISLVESTRRDPSLFEYIESESKTNAVHYAICHSKTPRRFSMLKSEVADPICHSKYINQFPEGIRNYIVEMKDVQADGNCGFRAIAALIGGDENEWKGIRAAMLEELTSNSSLYEKVASEKGRTEELYHRLDYFGNGPAPKDKWLTMPDMGHIVASAFKVVFVFLSDKQFLTFLPFYAAPHPSSKRDVEDCVCSMGLVNNDHFVQLYMSPGSPMPPIASNWLNNRQPHAKGWSAPFCSQIKEFRRIIGSDVATRETFDLID